MAKFIKAHKLLCHVTTTLTYWLKSKILPKKGPLMTNNIPTQAISFISICAF